MNNKITNNTLTVEIRNQARWLFFVGLLGITACIGVSSAGAIAVLLGKTTIGVYTAIASTLSLLPFMQMTKTAHNWLSVAKKQLPAND